MTAVTPSKKLPSGGYGLILVRAYQNLVSPEVAGKGGYPCPRVADQFPTEKRQILKSSWEPRSLWKNILMSKCMAFNTPLQRTRACRANFLVQLYHLARGLGKVPFSRLIVGVSGPKSCGGSHPATHCYWTRVCGTRARPHTRAPSGGGGARVWVMFIYIDSVAVADPAPSLGRCAPSVRLGTRRSSGPARRCSLRSPRLVCPLGSAEAFHSMPDPSGDAPVVRCSGPLLAAAPPRGSAALGMCPRNGLGRAGEVYEHSARLARAPQAPPSESAPRALVPSRSEPPAPRKCPSEALTALLSDFYAAAALPGGYASVRPSTGLTALQARLPPTPYPAAARHRRTPSVK